MLEGTLSKLKKKTQEEIDADKAARAAKADAAAAAAGATPRIQKFASVSERYDAVNKKMVRLTAEEQPRYNRLAVWRDEARIAYMAPGGIPITKDLLMENPDGSGWPIENPAAVAAARAAKAGTSTSAAGPSTSASIGTDTGVPDPTAKVAVLNADGTLFKKYEWGSRRLKELMRDQIVRLGGDGRLYRRSADEINAEREALAAATAAPLPKVGPSTVLSRGAIGGRDYCADAAYSGVTTASDRRRG
jgi:hypothetical protein